MNFVKAYSTIQNTGGVTFSPIDGEYNPDTGFIVPIEGYCKKYPIPQNVEDFKAMFADYQQHKDVWDQLNDRVLYFGCWVHNGVMYLDLCERIEDRIEAVRLGVERKQIAIYDCELKQEIYL